MMEKIILTWEQHEAIEELKKSGWTTHRVFDQHVAGWNNRKTAFLNNYNLDEVNNLFFEKGSYVVEKPELKFEPAPIPTTIEEYNRQEELKAKYRQEERMMSLQDTMQEGINAIKQLVSVLGEKVHKNIQANINFNPKIKFSDELIADLQKGEMVLSFKNFIQEKAVEGTEKMLEQAIMNGFSENEQEHLNNPFYKKVDEITEKVAVQQILKGAEKYPEPFNPASWTGEQLVNHGLQEARDLQVYLVGLAEHIERIEKENEHLRNDLDEDNSLLEDLKGQIKTLRNYATQWKEKTDEKQKEIDSLKDELEKVKKSKDKWKANYLELETKYFGIKYPNR